MSHRGGNQHSVPILVDNEHYLALGINLKHRGQNYSVNFSDENKICHISMFKR